jgi:hypothetical protein
MTLLAQVDETVRIVDAAIPNTLRLSPPARTQPGSATITGAKSLAPVVIHTREIIS